MTNPRTIVINLDTIAKAFPSNVCDAIVVHKLDDMFEDGWDVVIHTSKGVRDLGSIEAADAEWRGPIESFLETNGVKYTRLQFGKPLPALYVDEHAVAPEAFKAMSIKQNNSGLSGAVVQIVGDRVIKTHPNTPEVVGWYKEAKNYCLKTPEIISVDGDILTMERIKGPTLAQRNHPDLMDRVLYDLQRIVGANRRDHGTNGNWGNYVRRVEQHMIEDRHMHHISWKIKPLLHLMGSMNRFTGFCHGDLSLDNLICYSGKVEPHLDRIIYIDPNPMANVFRSWVLDISKLAMSCILHSQNQHMPVLYKFASENGLSKPDMNTLIITHWIRMLKYVRDVNPVLYGRAIENINILLEQGYQ